MSFKKFRKFYANPGNPFDALPVAVFLELNKNWSMQVQFPETWNTWNAWNKDTLEK